MLESGVASGQHGRVSVIIPSFNSGETITRMLVSLQNQEQPADYEVIVVDSSGNNVVADLMQRFPIARLIRLERRAYPGSARNIGVAMATGEILAFTNADCVVGRDWIRAIRVAHQTGVPVIGGTIANPQSWVGWMYSFCKLSQWLPTREAREMRDIPTAALTMQRWVYDQFWPVPRGSVRLRLGVQLACRRAPRGLMLTPKLEVGHHNFTKISRAFSKLFEHGREYARIRAQSERWSGRRCLVHAATAIASPVILFALPLGASGEASFIAGSLSQQRRSFSVVTSHGRSANCSATRARRGEVKGRQVCLPLTLSAIVIGTCLEGLFEEPTVSYRWDKSHEVKIEIVGCG